MRTLLIVGIALVLCGAIGATQGATTVFKGRPSMKITEGGVERLPEELPRERAINLECVISQIGDTYYWASRENVEMARVESRAFVIYLALNGSGYVRMIRPEFKKAASLMSPTEEQFDYVEHLLIGLKSVTYYGERQ
jgi:hypothetical protein